MHEPKDCPYKSANATRARETEVVDANSSGLLMMDLADFGFVQLHSVDCVVA